MPNYLTHGDIASLIGSSRQTVTTLINELEGEGILSYSWQEICFMNVKKLQKLVSENSNEMRNVIGFVIAQLSAVVSYAQSPPQSFVPVDEASAIAFKIKNFGINSEDRSRGCRKIPSIRKISRSTVLTSASTRRLSTRTMK